MSKSLTVVVYFGIGLLLLGVGILTCYMVFNGLTLAGRTAPIPIVMGAMTGIIVMAVVSVVAFHKEK